MKKLILCLFVPTLLTPLSLFAQPTKYVKLGINHSSFRTEEGKSKPALTFGFGKDYYPIRFFKGFFGFEVNYARKTVLLKNRNWPAEFNPSDSDIVTGDIKADISFLDLPLNYQKNNSTIILHRVRILRRKLSAKSHDSKRKAQMPPVNGPKLRT